MNVCNEKQLEEYYSDSYWEQGKNHFHSIESDRVLCKKYIAEASCYTKGGPRKLICFDELTNQRKRLEFLYGLWKTITNDTSLLGTDFIDSCSAFSNFKQDYLKLVAGCENCCTFEDYAEKDTQRYECFKNARQSYDKGVVLYRTMSDSNLNSKW